MKNLLILILFFYLSFESNAYKNYSNNDFKETIKNLKYRNVGPTRGGRVTSVHGVDSQKNVFYMGTTGGGVWKTTDYGNNWYNISDGYFKSPSIGAINVYKNDPNIVYVGTGSDGLRSNIIVGKGIYKSVNAGKTWDHIGLENVGQIGAVEIHPDDPNTIYVAAIGQPFKNSQDRGLYKSTNGGKSWDNILYLSDSIGIVDIEFAPDDPNTIYAASWRAERKPWTIISGSSNGGAYKSPTWTSLIYWTQPTSIRLFSDQSIDNLMIYPNPSRDVFNIIFKTANKQDITLRIRNIVGEEIYTEELNQFDGTYTKAISLENYPKAVYFFEISTAEGTINKKLVLQ